MSASNTVDLEVRIGDRSVTQYPHEGKTFVEAREGSEYALRVKNPHPFRVKVVLSVDGVNVVSGEPASGEREETGYILNAYETQTIKGYRLSDAEVAAFRFTKAEGGYAQAEKGLKGTTGVIGCKVWRERPAPEPVLKEVHHHHTHWRDRWYDSPWWSRPYYGDQYWLCDNVYRWSITVPCGATTLAANASATNAAFNSSNMSYTCSNAGLQSMAAGGEIKGEPMRAMGMNACSAAPQVDVVQSCLDSNPFDAGSTFGEKVESKVTSVAFVTDYCLGETSIWYAFKAGLTALGIDLTKSAKIAFPAAFSGKYCSVPKGWVG